MAQWFFEPRHTAAESGPLMDRVDIHIDEPAKNYCELRGTVAQESSANVRARIVNARESSLTASPRQGANLRQRPDGFAGNPEIPPPGTEADHLLERAIASQGLSARAHNLTLQLARTAADLSGTESTEAGRIAQATRYRTLHNTFCGK